MIRDGHGEQDVVPVREFVFSDIDMDALHAYRTMFRAEHPAHVWNGYSDSSFLTTLGGQTSGTSTEAACLTMAGVIMFGKSDAVHACCPGVRLDYLDKTHLLPGQRWSHRITDDGTWEYNLFNYVRLVLPHLGRDLPRPFQLRDGARRMDDTLVHASVREALINMVVHCDYRGSGTVLAIKEEKGFSFSNPGSPRVQIDSIYIGGTPEARNPTLQKMLRMIGFGENIGSGFPLILDTWRKAGWPVPDLSIMPSDGTRLRLWTVSETDERIVRKTSAGVGQDVWEKLNDDEKRILVAAFVEESITTSRICRLLGISRMQAASLIRRLNEARLLKMGVDSEILVLSLDGLLRKKDDTQHDAMSKAASTSSKQIYEYIQENGRITSEDVLRVTGITTLQGARKALRRMKKQGLIQDKRDGRHVYYVFTETDSNEFADGPHCPHSC